MIPSYLYSTVFLYSVIVLTFLSWKTVRKRFASIKRGSNNWWLALTICAVYAIWLGERSDFANFGDSYTYSHSFYLMQAGQPPQDSGEWIWSHFMYWCAQRMNVHDFFLIVEIGYFGFTFWACKRFAPNNVLVALLFCMGAFSFYTYGVNGIRNGLACSMVLTALSYVEGGTKNKIIAAALAFVAINIHRSTALPILMSVISLCFIRSFKWAYTFWILSIFISLVAGGAITSLFAGMGFDDRLSYLTAEQEMGVFSRTGFRWDFLLYSMMPIVLGYYVVIRRGIRSKTYELLLNTYTLSNAFWVIVIRANYSNRFAYLSWFMYPLVLAYPLLRMNIWGKVQGVRLKEIMFAQIFFTWFMQTIYW